MKTVTLGEIMLRLSPEAYRRFVQADKLEVHFGGGEANVAVSLAAFGDEARFVTKLPAHDLGTCAVRFLNGCGVDTSCILRGGERLGVYFYERAVSSRAGRVIYDRKNSAFALSSPEEYDFDAVFAGADFFHITGITPAIGAVRLAETAMREAKRRKLTVSFDPNFRANLWTEGEARECFERLLPLADVLISSSDGLSVLGLEPTGEDAEKTIRAAETLRKTHHLHSVALTMRGHISAGENRFSAVYHDGAAHVSPVWKVSIVDRVGGGDAFAAGLIHAIKRKFGGQEAVEFATAAGVFKHTVEGDANFASEEEIFALMHNAGGRVSR